MGILSVARDYLVWHYGRAYVDVFNVWWNYLWFVNHLFSVPDVLMTLFSPFKRLQEERVNILLHPEAFFSGLVVNMMMRIVGFVLRMAILVMAFMAFLVVIIGGTLFLVLWTVLPLLIVLFLRSSLLFLFQYV